MKSKFVLNAFACAALLAASGTARADIVATLNFDPSNQAAPPDTTDYEGNFFDGTSAPYDITVGTFTWTIPVGESILGATISGTFGDVNLPGSALTDLFVDGTISVGKCDDPSALCATNQDPGSLVSWSQTLTASELSGGSLTLTAVQNSLGQTVVGDPMLDIQVTPEPALIFPLTGGLLAIAFLRRRK